MINDITQFTELLDKILRPYVEVLTFGIDIAAGLVIVISAIIAFVSFLKILTKSRTVQTHEKETIRLSLARGMILALDFEVGSDILKTILLPGVNELAILGVIVAIRIGLSWSLSKEINRHHDIKTKIDTDLDKSNDTEAK
ncbi:MAG: DUF1622 domain-containing protein [Candidatus Nitrosocosmicus sp.]|jgi:uncharacterized membrane protein|uniref:DUF1622 domain-containing protein n=1 Tax=Candidatus Nitrosocosmicus agrestis TaxID=2563600 RepID=UPI00122E585C|nr:DUF1622 domain-containing protein [Candidatus Nitrosocosmicus sp. SS]KAA2280438.1 DUF1622 domain-containing protein [Candidatus Nitrosocosmicus sp. SS]KAF0869216.1 DUF1622 domain-containing protein [Candidatus Nitrosocosmicus sp. SS]MDR4491712.1 DUF1622 domain-containing protein [Candidatus Nitrosocosmicus sp.]HET6590418.1 DUF1622 domain-containing protein [Candidatus Nitrosocosmicus sp.]